MQALKKLTNIERQGLMLLSYREQLSNELLAPRLDDPKETFYDPQTKQLKPIFAWYLTAMREGNAFARDYLGGSEAMLAQVRAERASGALV